MLDIAWASETATGSDAKGWPPMVKGAGAMALLLTMATTLPTDMRTGPFAWVIGLQNVSSDEVRLIRGRMAATVTISRAMVRRMAVAFHLRISFSGGDGEE